jgi:hypothetical protein
MTNISSSQILTKAASVPFPLTAGNGSDTDVYFVYGTLAESQPLTGMQLKAQAQSNNDVLLTWSTPTEFNSKNFTIERSSDNTLTWTTVGTVPTKASAGNSSVPLTYTFTDKQVPAGNYAYRVIETDIDGSVMFSNTVPIGVFGDAKIFPNPANSQLTVILPATASSASFRLIGTDGKIVVSGAMQSEGGFGKINVSDIIAGVYILQVDVNNSIQTYKVQIAH